MFCVGGNTNFMFCVGETQILAFSDTNMLVSPTQNSGVGGLSQSQGPTQLFCVAVEYRLKSVLTESLENENSHGKVMIYENWPKVMQCCYQ